jgi:hypothetical protein
MFDSLESARTKVRNMPAVAANMEYINISDCTLLLNVSGRIILLLTINI